MNRDPARLAAAYERFDAANAADPNREVFQGQEYPKELLYAQRMTAWLARLAPEASEPLRLAARCQHIERWKVPREEYPMDRRGYKDWRTAAAEFHARTASTILAEVGYDADTIGRVAALLKKERLKLDPEVQTLEDVICLVFLEFYFLQFAVQHDEEQLVPIVRKVWKKMSAAGRSAALALELPPEAKALVEKALAASD